MCEYYLRLLKQSKAEIEEKTQDCADLAMKILAQQHKIAGLLEMQEQEKALIEDAWRKIEPGDTIEKWLQQGGYDYACLQLSLTRRLLTLKEEEFGRLWLALGQAKGSLEFSRQSHAFALEFLAYKLAEELDESDLYPEWSTPEIELEAYRLGWLQRGVGAPGWESAR